MNKELKYKYYSKGFVILKNVLRKKDLDECKKQILNSYKKIFNKELNYKNIHNFLTECENNKEWDKMYVAFKDVCKSKSFLKFSIKNFMYFGSCSKSASIVIANLNFFLASKTPYFRALS